MQVPDKEKLIKSPLNYVGGKYKLLPQLLPLFPKNIDTFVDLFCGGGNVGINVNCKNIIYNDINEDVMSLYRVFCNLNKTTIFDFINETIIKYGLSRTSEYGYEHYDCNSTNGLGEYNKEKYIKLREKFNKFNKEKNAYYYVMLYVLIIFAFNNQIRFNSNGKFNLPVGKRDFNKNLQNNLSLFIDKLKLQKPILLNKDFEKFNISLLKPKDFVYIDPPYLITCATYNENGGWSERNEIALLSFIDKIHNAKIKFALSNVLSSKGNTNEILLKWLDKNAKIYTIHHLNFSYSNSNYHTKDKTKNSDEVLITNYKGDDNV